MSSGDYNHIPDLLTAIHEGAKKAVAKAALDCEAKAKQNAPVDTGYMRNSVYAVTPLSSDYHSGDKSLPEVDKPADDLTAIVAVGASYSDFVEHGTRFMPAQPFLTPAADSVRGSLAQTFAALLAAEIKRVVK